MRAVSSLRNAFLVTMSRRVSAGARPVASAITCGSQSKVRSPRKEKSFLLLVLTGTEAQATKDRSRPDAITRNNLFMLTFTLPEPAFAPRHGPTFYFGAFP